MAFNPFHSFRKHQKVIFAVMAIVCMFVFVLQFAAGRGDPLQRIMDWFGARRNTGEVVTTLYSKKVYQNDLERLAFYRQLANELVREGARGIEMATFSVLINPKSLEKFDLFQRQNVSAILNAHVQHQSLFRQDPEAALNQYAQDAANLLRVQKELQEAQKDEQAQLVGVLVASIRYGAWSNDPRNRGEWYFGGSRKTEDLLDFLVWKHQADRLGIVLTEADVFKALNLEFGQPFVPGDKLTNNLALRQFLGNRSYANAPVSDADFVEALTEEYRVAFAKEAVLGAGDGARAYRTLGEPVNVHQAPTLVTPDEFLKFYRDQRTSLNVVLLPIPVEHYLDQVKDVPGEADLNDLYERYKSQEPAPDRDRPGFKEPRRIRVEYVVADAENKFYKDMAGRMAALSRPLLAFGAAATNVTAGIAPLGVGVAAPLEFDPLLLDEYSAFQRSEKFELLSQNFGVSPGITNPAFRAAGVAGLALSFGPSPGNPLPALAGQIAGDAVYRKTIASAASAAVLAQAAPTTQGTAFLPMPFIYGPQPLEAVRASLESKALVNLARRIRENNLTAFTTELAKLKGKAEEAAKYVEKAAKDYGFQLHKPSELRTHSTLGDDPALKPFKDAFEKDAADEQRRLPNSPRPEFASLFFGAPGTYVPESWSPQPLVFDADKNRPTFVYWRTEDDKARERPFAEARPDVVKAWKTEQARRLARKEAERIQKELKARDKPADAVKFLRDQQVGAPDFELTGVSKLVKPAHEVLMGPQRQYRPYQPPEDKIRYPRDTLVSQLLTLQKPGDSIVLRDKPEAHFYVAVLVERVPPTVKEFYEVYRDFRTDPIWRKMEEQAQQDYRKKMLEQLRGEAGPVHEAGPQAGRFVINEAARTRGDTGETSE